LRNRACLLDRRAVPELRGKRQADGLGGAADAELLQHLRPVGLDGADRQAELPGDDLVRLAPEDAAQDVALMPALYQGRDLNPQRIARAA